MSPTIDGVKRFVERAYNWLQGCRFFENEDEHGKYLDMTEKCCPYPVLFDWSAKSCIKSGNCGCVKGAPVIEGDH